MKQIIFFLGMMLVIACDNNGKQTKNTSSSDTTNSKNDKTEVNSKVTTEAEEEIVNRMLQTFRKDLRVVQLKDINEKDVNPRFNEEVDENRKYYPGYPFIAIGDFNGDNIKDYAAIVTDDKSEYSYINTWLAFFPSGGKPVLTEEYSSLNAVLHTIKRGTVIKDPFEENPDITLKYDAVLLTNGDGPGGYVVWNGKKFEGVFWEG
ncbi:MAG TPA: hypothetical protein PKC72_14265 [Chitinophagaceae bacterium]|nr:hypothetical protein [Chitinophagaceae bacterium]